MAGLAKHHGAEAHYLSATEPAKVPKTMDEANPPMNNRPMSPRSKP